MQGRHDYILSQVFDRPIDEVDPGIVDICRLGVHQLFEMRVATHAAVSATVELARKAIGESKASYVNAILRKVSAEVVRQESEKSPMAKRVYASFTRFQAQVGTDVATVVALGLEAYSRG